jgi:hypothetical protein
MRSTGELPADCSWRHQPPRPEGLVLAGGGGAWRWRTGACRVTSLFFGHVVLGVAGGPDDQRG